MKIKLETLNNYSRWVGIRLVRVTRRVSGVLETHSLYICIAAPGWLWSPRPRWWPSWAWDPHKLMTITFDNTEF